MAVYFTADLHFFHENVIRFANRPFRGAEEMNAALIQNWNNRVSAGDEVYILGDVTLKGAGRAAEVLSQLCGKKYLIRGNHDKFADQASFPKELFVWIRDYAEITVGNTPFVLFHYPIGEWNGFLPGVRSICMATSITTGIIMKKPGRRASALRRGRGREWDGAGQRGRNRSLFLFGFRKPSVRTGRRMYNMTRREEREQAFVLIFQQSLNHETIDQIIDTVEMDPEVKISDFAAQSALGVEKDLPAIDEKIEKNIRGWKISRLSKVSLALLRLAIYEMLFDESIPIRVSINEAVDLAKKYGGAEDAPFINGVLGSVAKEIGGE